MKKEDIIELIGITLGIVVLTRIFYPCIQNLFSITDGYSAATLTSSILMAIVTAIYVRYTYRIFDATNKNTEQTARAQKIAYLERRLEKFYMPMTNALKAANIESIRLSEYILKNTSNKEKYPFDFNDLLNKIVSGFIDNHTTCMDFSYLAPNETVQHLNEFQKQFIEMFKQYLSPVYIETEITFTDEYRTSYNTIKMEMENDIESLKDELAKLVNI